MNIDLSVTTSANVLPHLNSKEKDNEFISWGKSKTAFKQFFLPSFFPFYVLVWLRNQIAMIIMNAFIKHDGYASKWNFEFLLNIYINMKSSTISIKFTFECAKWHTIGPHWCGAMDKWKVEWNKMKTQNR